MIDWDETERQVTRFINSNPHSHNDDSTDLMSKLQSKINDLEARGRNSANTILALHTEINSALDVIKSYGIAESLCKVTTLTVALETLLKRSEKAKAVLILELAAANKHSTELQRKLDGLHAGQNPWQLMNNDLDGFNDDH